MTEGHSSRRDPRAAPLDLTIVVPAFNEEGRIGATLQELRAYLSSRPWRWEVVVVDDGSTDGTVRVVNEAAGTDGRVRVQREPHRGKGGAVRAGLLASNAAHRFICDADLSMPVHELERFMPPALGAADVAIGSREGAGARRVGEPLFRHVTGRVFNRLVQRLAVPGIEDTQCGFKMFTARAVETVFPHVVVDGWAFDIEVLYLARRAGLRILEVPIEWHYREESRLNMSRDAWRMLRELRQIRGRARRGAYPAVAPDRPP
jgi:dolichyl-phosphate beta-glucosyltransferase